MILFMRDRAERTLRFILLLGLLLLEVSLIVGFYVIPQVHAQKYAPDGHWEMEAPLHDSPGMLVALISYFGLLVLGNAGLVILVWRAFKNLVREK